MNLKSLATKNGFASSTLQAYFCRFISRFRRVADQNLTVSVADYAYHLNVSIVSLKGKIHP